MEELKGTLETIITMRETNADSVVVPELVLLSFLLLSSLELPTPLAAGTEID